MTAYVARKLTQKAEIDIEILNEVYLGIENAAKKGERFFYFTKNLSAPEINKLELDGFTLKPYKVEDEKALEIRW